MRRIFSFIYLSLLLASGHTPLSFAAGALGNLHEYDKKAEADNEKRSGVQIDPTKKRCPEIKEDLRNVRKAQLEHRLEKGKSLNELNKEYDQEVANFILLQGIKDLKADYVKQSQNLIGLSGQQIAGPAAVANFVKKSKALNDTSESLMRIAALSTFLNQLKITPGASSPDGEIPSYSEFMEKIKKKCQEQQSLSLCKTLQQGQSGNDYKKIDDMFKGFHSAFVIAQSDESSENKQKKMAELDKLLSASLPPDVLNGQALEKMKELKSKSVQLEALTSSNDFAKKSKEFQSAYSEYAQYLKDASKSDFYKKFVDQVNLDEKLGALKEASEVLEKRKGNAYLDPTTTKNILARYYQQKKLMEYREKERNPKAVIGPNYDVDKMGLADLYRVLGAEAKMACPDFKENDEGMALCLKSIKDDDLEKQLDLSRKKISAITLQIKNLQESREYQTLNEMQNALAIFANDICRQQNEDFEIVECQGVDEQGPWSGGANKINFLMNKTGEIISALDPATKSLAGDKNLALKQLSDACTVGKFAYLAGHTCTIAHTNQRQAEKPTFVDYWQKHNDTHYENGSQRSSETPYIIGIASSLGKNDPTDLTGLNGSGGGLGWLFRGYLPSVNREEYATRMGYMQADQNYRENLIFQQQLAFWNGTAPYRGFNFGGSSSPQYNLGAFGNTPYGLNPTRYPSLNFQGGNPWMYRSPSSYLTAI